MYLIHFFCVFGISSLYTKVSWLFGPKSFCYANMAKFRRNTPPFMRIIIDFTTRIKVAVWERLKLL